MKAPTPEQIQDALCQALCLDVQQLKTYLELLPTVQPWQKDWLIKMTHERASEKREVQMLRSLLENNLGLGFEVRTLAPTKLVLPPGYVMQYYEARGKYMVHSFSGTRVMRGEVTDWATEEEAIIAAYEHERVTDPYVWRPVSQTCPDQTLLFFACADWAHSVQLGKPVPTQSGYRNGSEYRIFGASWAPTHWCYQPAPPPVAMAEAAEVH